MDAERWIVEGAITSIVGDRVVEVRVETTSGDWPRGEALTVRISEDVDREPLGHPYEEGFLKEHYLGKRVHCVVRRRNGRLEAIRFELIDNG